MKKIYHIVPEYAVRNTETCLATLIATSGSAPQSAGSSALFSLQGLQAGTLGGGIMEGDARNRALEAIQDGEYRLYDFYLDGDINDREGAICGGSATILLDPDPGRHRDCFHALNASLEQGHPGCMVTLVSNASRIPIQRTWLESDQLDLANFFRALRGSALKQQPVQQKEQHPGQKQLKKPGQPPEVKQKDMQKDQTEDQTEPPELKEREFPVEMEMRWKAQLSGIENALAAGMDLGKCTSLTNESGELLFIEPVFPLPKLIIAGAGHIGRALSHLGSLLDFEVTVIDDRPDLANPQNLPDADHIIVEQVGKAISLLPLTKDTYIVIVTRGHQGDAEALRACIGEEVAYIGMIGSRRKIRSMKEKFLAEGWATADSFARVHAPIGIEIGSVSVQEIALSIAAQLVQKRAATSRKKKREQIAAVILAAGESRRMGKPKMLLPYGNTTIVETIVSKAKDCLSDHVRVVLGANAEAIKKTIAGNEAEQVLNADFKQGMLSSVQAGIRSLPTGTTAVMILLGDQPMIPVETMDRLIQHYKKSEKNIIIASTGGKKGHPMIFSAKYIPEILAYGPGETLRDLITAHPGEVEEMETGHPEILRDIDTPRDYENEIKNDSQ